MKDKLKESEIVFLNNNNFENFRNVKFDSIVINNEIEDKYLLNKILEKSKYVLYNSDIKTKENFSKDLYQNIITYGYNSKAVVTISSVTDESYLIYIQKNIDGYNKSVGIQEIKFEKNKKNINAYDGIITTIIEIIYNK